MAEEEGKDSERERLRRFVAAQVDFALASSSSPDKSSNTACPVSPGDGGEKNLQAQEGCRACQALGSAATANNMPKIDNNEGPTTGLSTQRQVSSIPIGQSDLPNHQVSV